MKEINFQIIEDTIIQKYLSELKDPENGFAKAVTVTAAKLAVLALKEYHQQLEESQQGNV